MIQRSRIVEQTLAEARKRWRSGWLVSRSCFLGTLFCGLVLCLGLAVRGGLVTTWRGALISVCALGAAGLVCWTWLILRMLKKSPRLPAVAAAIERKQPRLQDRLNTLLFLESRNERPSSAFAVSRIADQAKAVLIQERPEGVYGSRTAPVWVAAFVSAIIGLAWLGHLYAPWKLLRSSSTFARASGPPAPQVAPALTAAPAQRVDWGEVRITDPAADLQVTKVDVVPLSIESASEQDLKEISWVSSVNGEPPVSHELPPPPDAHYAAYQPTLSVAEMGLSDWDVLTYYAKAETSDGRFYASEVYFLEVRPFREDLQKLPGGAAGAPNQTLSDLSALVNSQQRIIRDTHAWAHRSPAALKDETAEKLSHAETDLAAAARHVYADLAASMENQPIATALDNLAKAQVSLGLASTSLEQSVADQAQIQERAALAQLVAARKDFQTSLSDRSEHFNPAQQAASSSPLDDSKRLSEMTEFRDEAKSAEEFVRNSEEEQRQVETSIKNEEQNSAGMAAKEQALAQGLKRFAEQHPRAFQGLAPDTSRVEQSLQAAQEKINRAAPDTAAGAHQATQDLERLRDAMETRDTNRQLADAYRLKRMLDQQAQKLGQLAKSVESGAAGQIPETAASAQATLQQLKRNVRSQSSAFGPPLQDALGSTNHGALDQALSDLQLNQSGSEQRRNVEIAQAEVDKLDALFSTAQPAALKDVRGQDLYKSEQQPAFAQGLKQLNSLLKQLEQKKQAQSENQAKQGREALANLQAGIGKQPGTDATGRQLLEQLQELLSRDQSLDHELLKRLVDQLERLSVESAKPGPTSVPELANYDPARLPPAYRGRIEKYFQKLSEE